MASYSLINNASSSSPMEPDIAVGSLVDEEKQVGDSTLTCLALEEHVDGSVTKHSPPLLDEKHFQQARQRKQLKLIALAIASLALIALVMTSLLYAPFRSSSDGQQQLAPEVELSACEIGRPLFADYTAESLDEWLDIDVDRVSNLKFSLSNDGSTMAMAAPEWYNNVRIIRNLGLVRRSFRTWTVDLPGKITNLALSGDGAYFVASDTLNTVLLDTATGESVPFDDIIANSNRTEGSLGYVVTDLAINLDGSTFAIAYGTNDTSKAIYDLGDERGYWEWHNYIAALTVVFDRTSNRGTRDDWEPSQFPMSFETDNFGVQLAMTSDGTAIFQSSEHDNRQHLMNQIAKSESMDAWYGTMELFKLLNYSQCIDTTSDVDVSSDGTTLVLALQCLAADGSVTLYVYPFVILPDDMRIDDTFRAWNMNLKPVIQRIEADSLHPMSVKMSGDARFTTVSVDGVLFEKFVDEWGSDELPSSIILKEAMGAAELSLEFSEDASVVVFSATNAAGASVCLFTR